METNNNGIPKWLLRICTTPLFIYSNFKQNGFLGGIKTTYRSIQVSLYFWLLRNCKWYRNRVYKNLTNQFGKPGELLFDIMIDTPNWNPKKLLNKHPEFKQQFIENFDKCKQNVIDDYIKSGELNTEEDIRKLEEGLKLEDFI